MASFIDPLPTATGAVGLAAAASGLGSETGLAPARASELRKTVTHPFAGTRVALERGQLRCPSGYHTNAARLGLTELPSDLDLTW